MQSDAPNEPTGCKSICLKVNFRKSKGLRFAINSNNFRMRENRIRVRESNRMKQKHPFECSALETELGAMSSETKKNRFSNVKKLLYIFHQDELVSA